MIIHCKRPPHPRIDYWARFGAPGPLTPRPGSMSTPIPIVEGPKPEFHTDYDITVPLQQCARCHWVAKHYALIQHLTVRARLW